MGGNFHEQLARPEPPLPSDRSTGLVLSAVLAVVAFVWRGSSSVSHLALGGAVVLAGLSLAAPRLLRPLNIAWMRLAMLIGRVMNPIVMLILFAVAIVPAGLIMQRFRDPLRARRQPDAKSYWIERPKVERSSMSNQF